MPLTLRTVVRSLAWLIAAAIVAAAAGWLWLEFAPRHVPQGQAALSTLGPESLPGLRDAFNAAEDEVRVLALLSPT